MTQCDPETDRQGDENRADDGIGHQKAARLVADELPNRPTRAQRIARQYEEQGNMELEHEVVCHVVGTREPHVSHHDGEHGEALCHVEMVDPLLLLHRLVPPCCLLVGLRV